MPISDVPAPGGWLNLYNSRIARWLVIGAIATTGGGGIAAIYGQSQGAQASWFCEAELEATDAKGEVSYSCLNPLPNGMTGAILGVPSNIISISRTASPETKLNICTASAAGTACSGNAVGTNVGSGVLLTNAKRLLSLASTGTLATSLTTNGNSTGATVRNSHAHGVPYAVLAPRDYPSGAKNRLNFTFQSGSGQVAGALSPAFVRIEVVPCNLEGVGC